MGGLETHLHNISWIVLITDKSTLPRWLATPISGKQLAPYAAKGKPCMNKQSITSLLEPRQVVISARIRRRSFCRSGAGADYYTLVSMSFLRTSSHRSRREIMTTEEIISTLKMGKALTIPPWLNA